MMKKRIKSASKNAKVLNAVEPTPAPAGPPQVDKKTFTFPINSKFMNAGVLYTVTKIRKDVNAEWRTVISAQHADQDYMLETLRRDAQDPDFIVVDDGTPSK